MSIDLPLIWAGIIALAVGLYVLLDGFDLGVGMLFPFARSSEDRDVMMNTIAPVWDGNETWLVLGGTGMMGAFPLAYGVLMPALYLPVILMLGALILRGVAFEFRVHGGRRGRPFWTAAFAGGSTAATLAQGFVLGGFIQGVTVKAGQFAGGPFDWFTPYTVLIAFGLMSGYALLGSSWLMMKSKDALHGDARRWTKVTTLVTGIFLAAVSVATLFIHPQVAERWGVTLKGVDVLRIMVLAPVPLLGVAGLALVTLGFRLRSHFMPFIGVALVFASGYLGLAVGFAPYIAPYAFTFREAASANNALALMLAGASILLPMILIYTVLVYWTFRGKVTPDVGYH
jgi:cytochrome d ubiquinol oxidase subunit II